MNKEFKLNQQTRRQFLKGALIAGSAFCLFPERIFSRAQTEKQIAPIDFHYKYRSVSVEHVKEMGEWIEKLKKEGKLSSNETYRKYIGGFVFEPEKIMPGAKSIVIAAIPQKIVSILFHKKGKVYEIKTPTGYFSDGLKPEGIKARLMNDVIKDSSKKLQGGVKLPLKTLAVRSGLAEYGKNNISFVKGDYGSFHRLVCYYTDQVLQDNWGPLKTMQLCKGCSICIKNCPTSCITESNFVIDVGKCVTLHNEVPDPIPSWVDPKVHNALMGCFKCQDICPANVEAIKRINKLAVITEAETELILNIGTDKKLQESVVKKLELSSADDIPYISRNLKLVIANTSPIKG